MRASRCSSSELRSITDGAVAWSSAVVGSSSASLMAGVDMFDNACLARLRGWMRTLAPFLRHLMPHLITLAPDLTVLEIEDVDIDDWSEEWDDFAEVFIDISRMKEEEKLCSPLNDPARSMGSHGPMSEGWKTRSCCASAFNKLFGSTMEWSYDYSPDWNFSIWIPGYLWKRVRYCPGTAIWQLYPYPSIPLSILSWCYPHPCHALLFCDPLLVAMHSVPYVVPLHLGSP